MLWLAMLFILVRYEAYPELFTKTVSGYRTLLPETVLLQDSWARIIINNVPAGYTHTAMHVAEGGPAENIEIRNKTYINISLAGTPAIIRIKSVLLLDPDYDLIKFSGKASAPGFTANISGQRSHDRIYDVEINAGGIATRRTVEIPKDVLVYSPLTMPAFGKLKPGQSLSIKTIDPFSMSPENIIIKAVKRETITHNGKATEAVRLTLNYHGIRLNSWVDSRGLILRQETPPGWIIESCEAGDALNAITRSHKPPEVGGLQTAAMLLSGTPKTDKTEE